MKDNSVVVPYNWQSWDDPAGLPACSLSCVIDPLFVPLLFH